MALPIGEELLKDMSVMVLNYTQICDLFHLSQEQRRSPNAGEWIIDVIKQYQTAAILEKSRRLQSSENGKVEDYIPPIPMPAKPDTKLPLDNG